MLTLVERKTQLAKIIKLPRATAHATQRAAVRRLKPIGDFVHTITFDNGKEFAAHQDIAHALKAKIFFATPYHAWERGLNENTNGLIRDFFPKGTDFSTIANAEVAKVERLLNARPRKSLGFRSPQEVFNSSLTRKVLCAGNLNPRKVIKWDAAETEMFDKTLSPEEIMDKLGQRVGPEGRRTAASGLATTWQSVPTYLRPAWKQDFAYA